MPFFKKKPVVIEAHRFLEINQGSLLCKWCGGSNEQKPTEIQIKTLEGTMTASLGDWIIQGVKGEFYPCKPDIFEATYELVSERKRLIAGYCLIVVGICIGIYPFVYNYFSNAKRPIDMQAARAAIAKAEGR